MKQHFNKTWKTICSTVLLDLPAEPVRTHLSVLLYLCSAHIIIFCGLNLLLVQIFFEPVKIFETSSYFSNLGIFFKLVYSFKKEIATGLDHS